MAVVIPDITPAELLRRFRGVVTSSRPAYPDVLHIDVMDAEGAVWWFGTFEATYSPSDPEVFLGKTVTDAELDVPSGRLTIGFSDHSELTVTPIALPPDEVDEDIESWNLFTPEGLVLNYGPGEHWVVEALPRPRMAR